jgi:hypothetical protein
MASVQNYIPANSMLPARNRKNLKNWPESFQNFISWVEGRNELHSVRPICSTCSLSHQSIVDFTQTNLNIHSWNLNHPFFDWFREMGYIVFNRLFRNRSSYVIDWLLSLAIHETVTRSQSFQVTVEWFGRSRSSHDFTSAGLSDGIFLHFSSHIPLLNH